MAVRPEIDPLAIVEMVQKGMTTTQIAEQLNVNRATMAKRIEMLREEQGLILSYRQVRHLNLTRLQAEILDAITPDKIAAAPLKDLCAAYKILADKEGDLTGEGEGKIKGLLSYLLRLEEQEANALTCECEEESAAITVEVHALPVGEGGSDDDSESLPNLR